MLSFHFLPSFPHAGEDPRTVLRRSMESCKSIIALISEATLETLLAAGDSAVIADWSFAIQLHKAGKTKFNPVFVGQVRGCTKKKTGAENRVEK